MNEDKATRYHRLRRRADLLGTAAAGALLLLLIATGVALWLREVTFMVAGALPPHIADVASAVLMAGLVLLLIAALELPVAFYQGYYLEHRYGLSTQLLPHWLADQVKGVVVSVAIGTVGAAVVYSALAISESWWWLIAAAAFTIGTVVLVRLAPILVLPLFYSFRPLDRPHLVSRLLALAARARTDVMGVFEWRLSAHTHKANAALAGMGRTRRILVSDTLLAHCSDDEIEVVLAHELSHHVHHDLWRGVALQTALLFSAFFVAHLALRRFADPLGLAGMSDPAGLPLLMLVGGVWSFLLVPVGNALSRSHERRADRYALEMTGSAEAFVSAMRRLAQQNMAEEHPSRLVQWLFYSHPPIRERIRFAQQWAESRPVLERTSA